MVTFKNMGRMGNFLFQAATAFAYAKKHDLDFTVPTKTNDKYWNPLYLQHLAKPMPPKQNIIIKEKGHAYQELPFEESWRDKNIILDGYWQSEKYFKEWHGEIVNWPDPNWLGPDMKHVSIHLRFGDYKMYPTKHPPMNPDYYSNAILYINVVADIYQFKVFSDDLNEAKKVIESREHPKCSFQYMTGNDELTDLKMISWCQHHINSSSTFSWWSAWLNLNPNKIIITPKDWFVKGHGGLDTSDIIPSTWIKL